jgi:acetolactate synthase small subunit
MVVIRELGIIARIALIFSRRGLDIATFYLRDGDAVGISEVSLDFEGNDEQLRAVVHDLRKLVDVYSVVTSVIRSDSNRPVKFTANTNASYAISAREQL